MQAAPLGERIGGYRRRPPEGGALRPLSRGTPERVRGDPWATPAGPHTINIMSTVFTANHADSGHPGNGNDIAVLATPNQINCPPPGTACGVDLPPGTTCCFEEDYESLSAVLPTSE